jgi:hypothetical protein
MRSINGYGKTIAFILTVMLPAPSLASQGQNPGTATIAIAAPLGSGPVSGALALAAAVLRDSRS